MFYQTKVKLLGEPGLIKYLVTGLLSANLAIAALKIHFCCLFLNKKWRLTATIARLKPVARYEYVIRELSPNFTPVIFNPC